MITAAVTAGRDPYATSAKCIRAANMDRVMEPPGPAVAIPIGAAFSAIKVHLSLHRIYKFVL